ncbi:thioredoxin [Paenibacillus swuensis]|uniref:Thioredoxin n=1 Tax=Paenibacillus swuensis TaxID=1178515 RepID=A0A172TMM3_9BACL|nr:thioredoxin family protein [Paenibacillus swuensis]ANE48278.1 thioredoxin [Paenibacillus swuensis]
MKKLGIFIGIIVALFVLLYFLNTSTNNNVYGKSESSLNPATRAQLKDPDYQNIIKPEDLDSKIKSGEGVYVYFFSSTCPHCKRTTPVLNPIIKEVGVDVEQFNLLEFEEGWLKYNIEGTPTLIYFKDGKEVDRLADGIREQGATTGNTVEDFRNFLTKHKGA